MKCYQLDTDVIVYHLRGTRQLQPEWLGSGAAISVVTLGELLYGAKKSSSPSKSTKIVARFIEDFDIEIISPDAGTMMEYAKQRARLEKKGQKIADFDLLIGVTAKQHGYTLATNNRKHFSRIGGLELV